MTTGIKDWSTTAGSNNAAPPSGAPEGMAPSAVNNVMRQIMAEVRAWYEDPLWIDFGNDPTYISSTSFRVSADLTARYTVGRRIKLYGSGMGTVYGKISASAYSAPNTNITVVLDSGALDATLSEFSVGPRTDEVALTSENIIFDDVEVIGKFSTPDDGELTISSGAITVTGSFHTIDTESDASTDDLVTINGGSDGAIIILRTENSSRDVVVKNSGNITTPDGNDITLSSTSKTIALIYDAALTKWLVLTSQTAKATTAQVISGATDVFPDGAALAPLLYGTRVYQTTGTTLPASSSTIIGFDTTDWDDGDLHDEGGDDTVVTVDYDGRISFVACVDFGTGANDNYAVRVYRNGDKVGETYVAMSSTTGTAHKLICAGECSVSAGDEISVQAYHGSGAGSTTSGTGLSGTSLSVRRLK